MTGNPVQIVLIEDNEENIHATLHALKKANISNCVQVMRNAAEALDYLMRTGSYAGQRTLAPSTLILLSLTMPSVHGLDLLRKLRADERTESFPVIMLTSSQEERGVMQSYKLGASGCIVKPVTLEKFLEAVAELRLSWVLMKDEDEPKNRD